MSGPFAYVTNAPARARETNDSVRRRQDMAAHATEQISPPSRRAAPTLVGRADELRRLTQAVTRPPAVIVVSGEAGIGKSRLVAELTRHPALAGRRILAGRCHAMREPCPLGPVVDAVRSVAPSDLARPLTQLAAILRPLLPELDDVLPARAACVREPRARRHLVLRALLELFGALGPAVCVLEDLQRADAETLDCVSFLVSALPEDLALVLTYRTEGCAPAVPALAAAAAPHVTRLALELSPLSVEDVGTLAGLLGSDALSDCDAEELHARTAGVPFAVEEVVREGCGSGVPAAVRHRVAEQLAGLTPDARALTAAAAVVDRPAAEALLRGVSGLSARRTTAALAECMDSALIGERSPGLYGFCRPLTRQTAYEAIVPPQRRPLHLRAAHALESGAEPRDLAQIARHFRHADRPRRWTQYAEAAAAAAHAAGDDDAALDLLEQALRTPGLGRAGQVRMALAAGVAALYSPPASCQRAATLLERALAADSVPVGVRGELRFSLCRLRFHAGDTATWQQDMHRAVDELGGRPELATRAMINLARPRLWDGDVVENLGWLRRAEQTAARQDDRVVDIALAAQRAAILLEVGDPMAWAAVREIPARTQSVDERLQLVRGYAALAAAAIGTGHHQRAEDVLAAAERLDPGPEPSLLARRLSHSRVRLAFAVGNWDGLELQAEAAGAPLVLSGLLAAQGELDGATAHAESALAAAWAALSIRDVTDAGAALARLQLLRGEPDRARRTALDAIDVARRKGIWVAASAAAPEAVAALLACGRRDDAAALVAEFGAGLAGRDAPTGAAALAWCRGTLGEADGHGSGAARAFAAAERRWRALPAPYAAAWARARAGRCRLRDGDERGGRMLLDALEAFDRLGADHDAARIRAILREERVPLPYPWRGGRRAYGDELSPREIEVARLAARGKTNREIAEALVLSRRTVAHHVSATLHKLKLASRTELAGLTFGPSQPKDGHPLPVAVHRSS